MRVIPRARARARAASPGARGSHRLLSRTVSELGAVDRVRAAGGEGEIQALVGVARVRADRAAAEEVLLRGCGRLRRLGLRVPRLSGLRVRQLDGEVPEVDRVPVAQIMDGEQHVPLHLRVPAAARVAELVAVRQPVAVRVELAQLPRPDLAQPVKVASERAERPAAGRDAVADRRGPGHALAVRHERAVRVERDRAGREHGEHRGAAVSHRHPRSRPCRALTVR